MEATMNIEKTGKLIADRRKKLGLTQESFGEMIGVTGKAVSKWERGLCLPDVALLSQIAVELKISIAQLLDGSVSDAALSSQAVADSDDSFGFLLSDPYRIELTDGSDMGTVSPYLFGNNLEHTRSSICGGLSAQMLKNRKFVGKPSAMEGVASEWFVCTERTFCSFGAPYTRHDADHYHMKRLVERNSQQVLPCDEEVGGGIGQHGLYFDSEKTYDFAIVAKCVKDVTVTVSMTDRSGEKIYASSDILIRGGAEWTRYSVCLSPDTTDPDADLRITFYDRVCLCIGCVSLMDHENFHGMRLDVIEAMKQLGITVLRWPGGNFAGEYNWFDGLLAVDERAPYESYLHLETQPHTNGYDFHEINTDDFVALCREIGAEPFITINIAWNTPEENAAWVEYCNGDASTVYGRIRAERGHREPYNVMLWSLGNEMGYGHMEGDNSPYGYSRLAIENGVKMIERCPNITLCSSGKHPDRDWAEYSAKPLAKISPLASFHHYSSMPDYTDLSRLPQEYEKCLSKIQSAREKIRIMRAALGDEVKISFDEWNLWNAWFRPSCIIDGMHTALMMHMIISEAHQSGVELVCHFEAVNESAIKVTPKEVSLTATGKMLKLMKVHCGGRLLYAEDLAIATEKEGITSLTLINPSYEKDNRFAGKFNKRCIKSKLFVGKDLMPYSQFNEKDAPFSMSEDMFETTLPPLSVALFSFG